MGFIQQPSLRIIDRGDGRSSNIVSLGYDFGGDDPHGLINVIPGRPDMLGTSFEIDLTAVAHPRTLPPIRSMQFTTFFGTVEQQPFFDGPLFFFTPSTGELLEFGSADWLLAAPSNDSIANACLTAVVGLVTTTPTKIIVAKGLGGASAPIGAPFMIGQIFINLYDFDRQPYVAQGYYNGFLGA